MKTIIKIIIGLAIGLFLFYYWVSIIDFDQVMIYISKMDLNRIFPAVFFYLLAYFIRSLRLYTLKPPGVLNSSRPLKIFSNYSYILAGNLVNYLIPFRAGEVIKAYFYKKNHDIKWSASLPSIVVDKIFDLFAIFVVLVLIPVTGVVFRKEVNYLLGIIFIVFLFSITVLIIATFKEKYVIDLLSKFFFLVPKRLKNKVSNFIHNFVVGISICTHKKKVFVPCFIYTFFAVILDSLFLYSMFTAFEIGIDFLYVLLGYTLINLSYILPQPPAQIGSNEIIMLLIFSYGFSLDKNLMSSVMFASHALTMIVIFVTGYLSLFFGGFRIKDFITDKETKG